MGCITIPNNSRNPMAKKKVTIYVFNGNIYNDTKIGDANHSAGYLVQNAIKSEFNELKKRLSLSDSPVDALGDTERMSELAKLYNNLDPLKQEVEIDT